MASASSILAKAFNIEDLQSLARQRVPRFALSYLESGADDHASLHWNRRVFESWRFVPDTLVNTRQRTLATSILGSTAKLPLIVAPTGLNGMLCHQADILLAQAARDAGIPFTLSTMSSASIEDVARHAPGVKLWFQLYVLSDRSITRDLFRRAQAAGCDTLVLTTDCMHYGNREGERRHFRAPMKLSYPALLDVLRHPAWIADVIGRGRGLPGLGNLAPYLPPSERKSGRGKNLFKAALDQTLAWDDLRFLRKHWDGKFIVKGILNAKDAVQAARLGADAIVLTNHGGRQLDGSISPMEVLEEIRAACGSQPGIFIDSGFRRGTDIAKALALGADAVMIGRPVLYGVAAAGLPGAAKAIDILASELDRTLGQLGVTSLAGLQRRHLRHNASPMIPVSFDN